MLTPYSRGSGTSGQVAYWNATRSLTGSSNLFWDNANGRLGIGTSSPISKLHIYEPSAAATFLLETNSATDYSEISARNAGSVATSYFRQYSASASGTVLGNSVGNLSTFFSNFASNFAIGTLNGGNLILGTANTERMRIHSTSGNVLIGTTTDAGYKLDVNGTTRLLGTTFGGEINGPSNFYINGSSNGAGTIYLRPATLSVSGAAIFTSSTTPQAGINVTGASNSTGANYWEIGTDANAYFINALNRSSGNYNKPAYIDAQRLVLNSGSAGSVLIGTSTDIASSRLTVASTTQGFLPPRMTTTQRDAISSPATGLIIFDTTVNKVSVYNGTTWKYLLYE
jgi:hypothetical protein